MFDNNIRKNISITFIANIISLIVSLLSTLLIPKIMGVTEYGYWQLYLFFISYAGLLHLGVCDGIYLTSGGMEYKDLNKRTLKGQFLLLSIVLIFICSCIVFISGVVEKDIGTKIVIIYTCVGAFFHIQKTFFLMILQSTNRLKEYSVITIIDRVIFAGFVIAFILIKHVSYQSIMCADIIGRILSLVLVFYYVKDILFEKVADFNDVVHEFNNNLRCGIQLLLSGIASNFIIGFVRLSIKNNWSIEEFGKISLSLSVVNMILSFVNMAAIVFFPIIKRQNKEKQIMTFEHMENFLHIICFGVLCFAGLGKMIIDIWLPHYKESTIFMILLFPICIYESETSMVLNTYLKALRKEKSLFIVNISIMIASMCFSYVASNVIRSLVIAVLGIDILIYLRAMILKMILYRKFSKENLVISILNDTILFAVYLVLYCNFNIEISSIIYLIVYVVFIIIKRKSLCKAIDFFFK